MSNAICYENSFVEVTVNDAVSRITYTKCRPPPRLTPKGTIVLLHDFFRTSYQFRYMMDLLAIGGYHTIAPDLPGSTVGVQTHPCARISAETLASCLDQVLRISNFQLPLHLVGCGLGATIATAYTLQYPDFVTTAIMVDLAKGAQADALERLSRFSPVVSRLERHEAFRHALLPHPHSASTLLNEDIQAYTDAYEDSSVFMNMQTAFRTLTTPSQALSSLSSTLEAVDIIHTTVWESPEDEPESFAIRILSFANMASLHTSRKVPDRQSARPEELPARL